MQNDFLIRLKPESILPWERAQELYAIARANKSYDRFGYGIRVPIDGFPDLCEIAGRLQMRPFFFVLYMTPRAPEVPIHVDGSPGNRNASNINWPLINCDQRSPTEWYSVDKPEFKIIGGSHFLANTKEAKLIHREAMLTEFKAPYLFRSDILHRGFSNADATRVILKWELIRDDWSKTVGEFRDLGFLN